MHSLNKVVIFNELKFIVNEQVYEPAEDSFLFAENLKVNSDESVLDMGTGCGLLAILVAGKCKEVVGIDVNPHALCFAKKNAKLNNVKNFISFIQGDLFTPIKKTILFDLILFNAPYLPVNKKTYISWIERAWAGGPDGRSVIDPFISGATKHVSKTGRILLLQSSLSDVNKTIFRLGENKMKTKIIAEVRVPFFETIKLIEAKY
jgi:release factor glutamine methyltransferase